MNPFSVEDTRADGLNANFLHGHSGKPGKALILLGRSEGGKFWNSHRVHIQQFIEQGYTVLSLAYFGADGLPAWLRAVPLEYFARAFR